LFVQHTGVRVEQVLRPRTSRTWSARGESGEVREKVIGEVEGLVMVVVFTMRGNVHWIISARRANRKERKLWQSFVAR